MTYPVRKALTFRASSIGDALMGKYFLENVHAAYPDARCAIVVAGRAAMLRDLFSAYPWLEVIEANRRDVASSWRLFRDWKGSDIVLTQYAGKSGGTFSFASKLAARVLARGGGLAGFSDASRMNRYLYDAVIPFEKGAAPAALERVALKVFSVPTVLSVPTLSVPSGEPSIALPLERFLVVHLFAGNAGRGLSLENKRALITALHERLPHTELLISGGSADRTEAKAAAEGIPSVRVIAGDVSLSDMLRIISKAAGVVSLDTGMAHIAAQVDTPLVVLASCLGLHWWKEQQYRGGIPAALFTRADLCAHGHDSREYPACLSDIDPGAVAVAAGELFVQVAKELP